MTSKGRPPLQPDRLLTVLQRHQVRFVVIGGYAAWSRGVHVPATTDIDITPAQDTKICGIWWLR
jgi:hypothetical protein